jgi:UDP-N-acetylglucosamine 2-epimerase (non-hydrolysing)
MRTLVVFGTRPEAIKLAPLISELQAHAHIHNKICITGQHQQMLDPLLKLFHLSPDFNLKVMTDNQSLSSLTAKILTGLEPVLTQYKPDCVVVHGDTTTTLAASLAAYYHQIPIAHIEAGLRTSNLYLPWPEEANRKLAAGLAHWHFAPTEQARQNLLREGVSSKQIHVTGNTVIDALLDMKYKIDSQPQLRRALQQQFSFLRANRKLILITAHRREQFGQGFERICEALATVARQFPDVDLIYPVHLNPNVQDPVMTLLTGLSNVFLLPPVDYPSFVYLMTLAYVIITDSGGVQEEAPSLGKPVLVMREHTERPEAVHSGAAKLVGTDSDTILHYVRRLLTDVSFYQEMSQVQNPYGDGQAAQRITRILLQTAPLPNKQRTQDALSHYEGVC